MEELQKRIIRTILDFCNDNDIRYHVNDFAISITKFISKELITNSLSKQTLHKLIVDKKDFLLGNNLNAVEFTNLLLPILKDTDMLNVSSIVNDQLISFKRKIENGSYRYNQDTKASEDSLRSLLDIFLIDRPSRLEPRTSSGNCDIDLIMDEIIIEVKIWRGEENHKSGIDELKEYLKRRGYKRGFYVVFDYSMKDNKIIKQHGDVYDVSDSDQLVTVIFIHMKLISPSKIYKSRKS